MIISKFLKNNDGFTLIEVLLSLMILGIVLTTATSLFSQAYSYTHMNQNKTVGINVARNVLYYIEQLDYNIVEDSYFLNSTTKSKELSIENCNDRDSSGNRIFNEDTCNGFFSTEINNVQFETIVTISKHSDDKLQDYLFPVEVTVQWGKQTASVEGLIKNEKIPN